MVNQEAMEDLNANALIELKQFLNTIHKDKVTAGEQELDLIVDVLRQMPIEKAFQLMNDLHAWFYNHMEIDISDLEIEKNRISNLIVERSRMMDNFSKFKNPQ